MKQFRRFLPRLLCALLGLAALAACASRPKPLSELVPGRQMETLQSGINIALKAKQNTISGRGYLVLQYPDRFHLALLSPFGQSLLDLYSDGAQVTCLVPSRQTAYTGLMSELPETGGLRSMTLLGWVIARPPQVEGSSSPGELLAPSGDRIYLDANGLIQRKVSPEGLEVRYSEYRGVNGVAFPTSLSISNNAGTTLNIDFDEPEINTPLDPSVLVPNLTGVSVQPLSQFKGI